MGIGASKPVADTTMAAPAAEAGKAGTPVSSGVCGLVKSTLSSAAEVPGAVGSAFSSALQSVVDGFKWAFDKVASFAAWVVSPVTSLFSSAASEEATKVEKD